uniref:AB hydrolase-1 domain-containing protein n=1 Tax=Tetradesmus obliquus TaxID=3088 RepID=A0A383WQ17_TETOB|eukprot:jgi/Sobl393_1/4672/SZX79299.1
MQGTLFKYGPGSAHVAFKSPATAQHPRCLGQLHLVLVGGLTDGLLFAPYREQLAAAAGGLGWSLVQAQLTSSYQGWGLSTLDQDASELRLLAQCLAEQHECSAWVLMGHSTGCQDAVRYVQRYRSDNSKLAGVILQAPVSDREYLSMYPSWGQQLQQAQAMAADGRADDVLCRVREWDSAALTARRFLSLYCAGGDDDMFSTDLTLQQLQGIFGPLHGLPCCIIQSAADEAVPQELRDNGSMQQLGQRMLQAISLGAESQPETAAAAAAAGGGAAVVPQLHVVEGTGHACAGHEAELVNIVCEFLRQLPVEQ